MKTLFLQCIFGVAMLLSIATTAFADNAPVFDVDNYPPQFDGQKDAGGSLPPPPSPVSTAAPKQQQAADLPVPSDMPSPPPEQQHESQPQPVASVSPMTLDQRVAKLEQQITNMQHSDSSTKLTELQNEVQALRGQIDSLTHQLQQAQSQQKAMYSDLDKRLSKQQAAIAAAAASALDRADKADEAVTPVSSKPKTPKTTMAAVKTRSVAPQPTTSTLDTSAAVAPSKSGAQPNVAEEQQVYQTAYDLIKAKKYDEAIATLQGMLKKYPSGQFAANAHYWLGELYGLQGKNDQSAVEFANVVRNYSDSPKVADAQLKLGLIYAAQFKWPDAKSAFKKVINHYPGTASSRLAAEQLKQIKLAGH